MSAAMPLEPNALAAARQQLAHAHMLIGSKEQQLAVQADQIAGMRRALAAKDAEIATLKADQADRAHAVDRTTAAAAKKPAFPRPVAAAPEAKPVAN